MNCKTPPKSPAAAILDAPAKDPTDEAEIIATAGLQLRMITLDD
ncbi:MAG: hypothetical protein ACRDJX_05440 [Solirubrobacteraceae bacterium]